MRLPGLRPIGLVCAGLGLLALPGCAPTPPTPATSSVMGSGSSPGSDAEQSPASEPPGLTASASAAEVRDRGVALGVGAPGHRGTSQGEGGIVWTTLSAQHLAVEELQGWSAYTLTAPAAPAARTTVALFAAPEQATFDLLLDGSAVVRDAEGVALAGLSAPVVPGVAAGLSARYEVAGPGLLRLVLSEPPGAAEGGAAAPAEVSFSPSDWTVTSLDWGQREGGRSLAVVANDWARSAGEAGLEVAWSEIVELEPEADVPGMYDQLACHAIGAPDKDAWNLEPWRPAVGLLQTLAAQCNP